MIPMFFSSARMILLECHESLAPKSCYKNVEGLNRVFVLLFMWQLCMLGGGGVHPKLPLRVGLSSFALESFETVFWFSLFEKKERKK